MPLEAKLSTLQADKLTVWQRYAPNTLPNGAGNIIEKTMTLALDFNAQTQKYSIIFRDE